MDDTPSSIYAWNEYLKTFVTELCETFPECAELFVLHSAIDAKIEEDEYSCMTEFVSQIEPYSEAVATMNEDIFLESDIPFLKLLGVQKYWTPDLEVETKDAIWQFLQSLLVMGKTIMTVPPEVLKKLEQYAANYQNKIGDVDPSTLDFSAVGMDAFKEMFASNPTMFADVAATQAPPVGHYQHPPSGHQQPFSGQQQATRPIAPAPVTNRPVAQAPTRPSTAATGGGFDRFLSQGAPSFQPRPAGSTQQFPPQLFQQGNLSFQAAPSSAGGNIWAGPQQQPLYCAQPKLAPTPMVLPAKK